MKSGWGENTEVLLWVEGENQEDGNVGVLGTCQLVSVECTRKGKRDELKARIGSKTDEQDEFNDDCLSSAMILRWEGRGVSEGE